MKFFRKIRSLFFSEKDGDRTKSEDEARYKKELQEWKRQAYLLGRNNDSLDNLLAEIKSRFSQVLHSIIEPLQGEIIVLEKSLKDTLDGLSGLSDNKTQTRDDLYSRAKLAVETEKANRTNRVKQLDRQIKALKDQKAQADAEVISKGLKRVKKTFFDTLIPTIIIVIATVLIDSPITWLGIERTLDLVPLAAFIISVGISGFLGMIGHLAGDCLTNRRFRMGSVWITLGIILLLTIIGMRWNVDGNLLITAAILVVLFATSILISMRYHRNRDDNEAIFESERLQKAIDKLEDQRDRELAEIHKLDNDANKKANDGVDECKSDLLKDKKSQEKELYSKKSKVAVELKNNADLETRTISEVKNSYNKGRSNDNPNMRAAIITFLFVATSFMSTPSFSQVFNIGVSFDKSYSVNGELTLSSEDVLGRILDIIELDTTKHFSGGAKAYLSSFGHSSVPKIIPIELEESGSWFVINRKDRREKVRLFVNKLKAEIDKLLSEAANQQQTHIYRSYLNLLKHLDPDSQRFLLSFSDQLEESSVLDMMADRYIKNPTLLVTEYKQMHEKLLSGEDKLPDLDGLQMTLFYDVHPSKDELSYRASKFWKRMFMDAGAASVDISGNL